MQEWNNWFCFLKLAETLNMQKAAQILKMDNSTLFRRINELEEMMKVKLFERLRGGYKLTQQGELALKKIKNISDEFDSLNLALMGEDSSLSGRIKISTSDTIGYYFLPKLLKKFHKKYPQIVLDIDVTSRFASLAKREADIIITPANKQPDYMIGNHLVNIDFALYAHKNYLKEKISDFKDLEKYQFIMPNESLSEVPVRIFLQKYVNEKNVVLCTDKFSALYKFCCAGMGIAPFPKYVGQGDESLVKVMNLPKSCSNKMWILTHPELKNNARIRIFMQFMKQSLIQS